jgi:hypothetical protein
MKTQDLLWSNRLNLSRTIYGNEQRSTVIDNIAALKFCKETL